MLSRRRQCFPSAGSFQLCAEVPVWDKKYNYPVNTWWSGAQGVVTSYSLRTCYSLGTYRVVG